MSLAAIQQGFMACLLDTEAAVAPESNARFAQGFEIYRNAYRARLVGALSETFPRTARWVGEEAFEAAAAHHLIHNPPADWTLDTAGRGFEATLADLFGNDPEVAELAWLEWAMHLAYVAADTVPLDLAGFSAKVESFGEDDWANLRLVFVPSLAFAPVRHDCVGLWRALGDGAAPEAVTRLAEPGGCMVWREALDPVCRLASAQEGMMLETLVTGSTYGEACARFARSAGAEDAARQAGAMLARWLELGLIADAGTSPPTGTGLRYNCREGGF